ncbi:hypothetical protein LCGC14_2159050 [marine sediment metagenome]|uniref:Uncharacterized protein n=1 Tax=marine sediment metagenome TaxID=412755 RepID=A0A0F9GPE0_9ZZZZ
MTTWNTVLDLSGKLKRTPRLAVFHAWAGGFLFGEDTPLKTDQLGAAGGEPRCGVWLPAAQGTLYSYKGQGFLPGRTGLNPLYRNTLGDQGLREIGLTTLPPPAGVQGLRGV